MRSITLWILSIALLATPALAEEDLSVLDCKGPACTQVATEAKLPTSTMDGMVIQLDYFALNIPPNPKRIIWVWDGIVADYGNGKSIIVGEIKLPEFKGSNYHANYYPKIIFMHTSKDNEPVEYADRYFWKSAIYSKDSYFDESATVTYSTRDDLTFYISNSKKHEFDGTSFVTHQNIKDRYFQIDAKGFDYDYFKKVVSTVRKKQGKIWN